MGSWHRHPAPQPPSTLRWSRGQQRLPRRHTGTSSAVHPPSEPLSAGLSYHRVIPVTLSWISRCCFQQLPKSWMIFLIQGELHSARWWVLWHQSSRAFKMGLQWGRGTNPLARSLWLGMGSLTASARCPEWDIPHAAQITPGEFCFPLSSFQCLRLHHTRSQTGLYAVAEYCVFLWSSFEPKSSTTLMVVNSFCLTQGPVASVPAISQIKNRPNGCRQLWEVMSLPLCVSSTAHACKA